MMFSLSAKNAYNYTLQLTGDENVYQVLEIEGLNPPQASIASSPIVGIDGTQVASTRLVPRNIVITVRINGDVETNRLNLYKCFIPKDKCTLYYSNSSRNVYIDAIVETVECGIFSNSEEAQISLMCPAPNFLDMTQTTTTIASGSSATTVANGSDVSTGCIIEITATSAFNILYVYNRTTDELIAIAHAIQSGDVITISTYNGAKYVRLRRSGVTSNIFTSVVPGSRFLQLVPGNNGIAYLAQTASIPPTTGTATVKVKFRKAYTGV